MTVSQHRPVSRRIAAGARTNVPAWPPKTTVKLDPAGRRHVLVQLGGEGDDVIAGWQASVASTSVVTLSSWRTAGDDSRFVTTAASIVNSCRVGDSVALVGPQADVYVLRALLLEAGFLDAEIVVHATSRADIRVQCAHCKAITRDAIAPGDETHCATCGYGLLVHQHFSARLGAFLGFRVDAEQPQ